MAFLSGPRQSGKTTLARAIATKYLSWDDAGARAAIVAGQAAAARHLDLETISDQRPIVVLDEIHKNPKWKSFLKGFFDVYADNGRIGVIATGSAKMDIYRRGGDSMMGRYFPYRIHPFSVAEIAAPSLPPPEMVRKSRPIPDAEWEALCAFGGFPEPFLRRDRRFLGRWTALRREQMLVEDVRSLTQIHELEQIRILADLLSERSGDQIVWQSLATDLSSDPKSAKLWTEILVYLYFGFLVKPWTRGVANSLRKTPKWFLRDWSGIRDAGKRFETMIACHLLKATEGWTDLGFGTFSLHYLRDKQKREVDFLVSRDNVPWFLVEAKASDTKITPALRHFHAGLRTAHAFQVVRDMPFVEADCFTVADPVAVPARTFLSQLL